MTPRFEAVKVKAVEWAEVETDQNDSNLREFLVHSGHSAAVEELVGAGAHYLDPAAKPEASDNEARDQLSQILEMQRHSVDLPVEVAEAVRVVADEGSEESVKRLEEKVSLLHESARADAELPNYDKRSGTSGA